MNTKVLMLHMTEIYEDFQNAIKNLKKNLDFLSYLDCIQVVSIP